MKASHRLIAGLGILMITATTFAHADDRGYQDQGRPGEYQQGHDDHGRDDHGPRRLPDNEHFDEARQAFHDHHEYFARGRPLPPNFHYERGRPLPEGYGERMDPRELEHLPRYEGYEWRRVGPDAVLVAVTTGVVYTILQNALN